MWNNVEGKIWQHGGREKRISWIGTWHLALFVNWLQTPLCPRDMGAGGSAMLDASHLPELKYVWEKKTCCNATCTFCHWWVPHSRTRRTESSSRGVCLDVTEQPGRPLVVTSEENASVFSNACVERPSFCTKNIYFITYFLTLSIFLIVL